MTTQTITAKLIRWPGSRGWPKSCTFTVLDADGKTHKRCITLDNRTYKNTENVFQEENIGINGLEDFVINEAWGVCNAPIKDRLGEQFLPHDIEGFRKAYSAAHICDFDVEFVEEDGTPNIWQKLTYAEQSELRFPKSQQMYDLTFEEYVSAYKKDRPAT